MSCCAPSGQHAHDTGNYNVSTIQRVLSDNKTWCFLAMKHLIPHQNFWSFWRTKIWKCRQYIVPPCQTFMILLLGIMFHTLFQLFTVQLFFLCLHMCNAYASCHINTGKYFNFFNRNLQLKQCSYHVLMFFAFWCVLHTDEMCSSWKKSKGVL